MRAHAASMYALLLPRLDKASGGPGPSSRCHQSVVKPLRSPPEVVSAFVELEVAVPNLDHPGGRVVTPEEPLCSNRRLAGPFRRKATDESTADFAVWDQ